MPDDPGEATAPTVVDPGGASAQRSRDALPTATVVGRYVLVEEIGAGGMGVVYAAYDPKLDRRIAIKLLRARGASGDREQAQQRLLREAQALAQLSHPNVVAVHDVGTYGDNVFLAMELVAGRSLRDRLEKDALSLAERRRIVVAAGRGLAAAHRAGLIHRDVKPANILIGDDGRVLVVDFGLARAVGDVESRLGVATSADASETGPTPRLRAPLTEHGMLMGTPRYMAPEALRGDAGTPLSDQFSFCNTAFETLYGVGPFSGADRTELVEAIQHGEPQIPDGVRVPARLRRALLRGLSKDPAARFPSMDALLVELAAEPLVTPARAFAAGIAALAIAAIVWTLSGAQRSEPCGGARAELASVWDANRRAALRTAFAGTGVPYAPTTIPRVEAVLDRYADGWVAMRTESCKATRVRGTQSEHLLDLRTACLDRRRQQLGALVTLFATAATPDVIKTATTAAGSLPPVSSCGDVDALTATVPPPDEPEVAHAVAALRRSLDDSSALVRAGRYDRALETLTPLAAEADRLAYAPARAEVYRLLGEARSRAGDGKGAIAAEREAIRAAARGRDDRLVAEAWVTLVYLLGQESRHDEALLTRDTAEAAIERVGADPVLRATLLNNVGAILNGLERYTESEPLFAEAIALRERAGRADDVAYSGVLSNLALALSEQNRNAEARRYHDRVIALDERILGPDHPELAISHHNLGNLLADEGDTAEAERHYLRAIEIWERALGPDFPLLASPENALGSLLTDQRRFDEAWPHFERAYQLWRTRLGDEHPKVAIVLFNFGEVRLRQRRHDEALDYFQRALAINEKALGPDHPAVSFALYGIGECELARGHTAKALATLERAWKLRSAVPSSPVELGWIQLALAKAVHASGDRARARTLATEARERLGDGSKWPSLRDELDAWLRAH